MKPPNGKCSLASNSPDLHETPSPEPSPLAKKESMTESSEGISSTELIFNNVKPVATCQGRPTRTSWEDRVFRLPSLVSKSDSHQDNIEPLPKDDLIRFNAGCCGDSDSITSSSLQEIQDFMNKRTLVGKTSNQASTANIDSDSGTSLDPSSKHSPEEESDDTITLENTYEAYDSDISDSSNLLAIKSLKSCVLQPQIEFFVQALSNATPNLDNLKEISSLENCDDSKREEEVSSVFRHKRRKLSHKDSGKQVSRTSTYNKSGSVPGPSPATPDQQSTTSVNESEETNDDEFKNLIVTLRSAMKEDRLDQMFDEMIKDWREKKQQYGVLVKERRFIKLQNIECKNDFLISNVQLETEKLQLDNLTTQVQQTLESLHHSNTNCENKMINFREINGDLEKLYFEAEQLKSEDENQKDLLEKISHDIKETEELSVHWQEKINFVTGRLEALLELQNSLKREELEIKDFIAGLDSVKMNFNAGLAKVTKAVQVCTEQRLVAEARLDSLRKKESLLKEHLEAETRTIAELDLRVRKSEEMSRSWMRMSQYSGYFLDAIQAVLFFLLPISNRYYYTFD